MLNSNRAIAFIWISLAVTGCATKDTILPVPDKDMHTVYTQHMQGTGSAEIYDKRTVLRRPLMESEVNLADYTRTESSALKSRFKLLPNPTMYMYVAPHLATESDIPIPGYLTEFKMFDTEHYAMPGEVADIAPNYQGGGQ